MEKGEFSGGTCLKWSFCKSGTPRPLPCWGRGVPRTPVAELPDFSGIFELQMCLHLDRTSLGKLGRGRATRRHKTLCQAGNRAKLVGLETCIRRPHPCDQNLAQCPNTTAIYDEKQEQFLTDVADLPVLINGNIQEEQQNNSCDHSAFSTNEDVECGITHHELSVSSSCNDDNYTQFSPAHDDCAPVVQSDRSCYSSTDAETLAQASELHGTKENSHPLQLSSTLLDVQDKPRCDSTPLSLCATSENNQLSKLHSSVLSAPSVLYKNSNSEITTLFLNSKNVCKFLWSSCPHLNTHLSEKSSEHAKTEEKDCHFYSACDITSFNQRKSFEAKLLSPGSLFSSGNCSSTSSCYSRCSTRYSWNSWSTASLHSRDSMNSHGGSSSESLSRIHRVEMNLKKKESVAEIGVDSVLEPVSTSSEDSDSRYSSGELPIPEFLKSLTKSEDHLKKPEVLLMEINSVHVRRIDIVNQLHDLGAGVYEIDLIEQKGNFQKVKVQILNCDGAYIVENLNGSSPFGPSVGAVRCKLF